MSKQFFGCITALITPFRNGEIDVEAYKRQIEWQIVNGVDALVPCGTTGEHFTLSHDEHDRVIDLTVRFVNGRVPVMAGTGSNNTIEAIRLTQAAEKAGVDGALLMTPYGNRPRQSGLIKHYKSIRDSTNLPLVMYNVPKRTGTDLLPETVLEIYRYGGYVAIKEAFGTLDRMRTLMDLGVPVFSGDDDLAWPAMEIGAVGIISVDSNFAIKLMVKMCRAARSRPVDVDLARACHAKVLQLSKSAFCVTNPIPVKGILAGMGRCANELRLPLDPLTDEEISVLMSSISAVLGPESEWNS